jgi:SAM-dependent methyltransferase
MATNFYQPSARFEKYPRCPSCFGEEVALDENRNRAICATCHQTYQLVHGIPCLTTEDKDGDLYVDIERHNKSAEHYSQKPLHHFFDLDTSPIGKYLARGLFRPDQAIFEIGCGTGTIAEIVQEKTGSDLFGVDIAPGSLIHTKRLGIPLLLASNINLPLKDDISDLTVSNGVIHHTPNPKQCLAELGRITKNDGHIILVVHRKYSFYWLWYLLYSSLCKSLLNLFGKRIGNVLVCSFYGFFFYLPFWFGRIVYQHKIAPPGIYKVWLTFNDQFLSPTCTFHTFEEVSGWTAAMNLRLVESFNFVRPGGGAISFLFKKVQ